MGIIKTIFGVALLGAVAFAGDYYNINDRLFNPVQYQDKKVEEGYYRKPLELEKRIVVNNKGNLETYIITSELKLPVLQGSLGPQVGDSGYVWNNLPQQQRNSLITEGWKSMDESQKIELAKPLLAELVGKLYNSFLSQLGSR